MTKIGSPFQAGTLGSVVLSALLTCVALYYYLTIPDKKYPLLLMLCIGLGTVARNYFKYMKMRSQGDRTLIGDSD